MKLEDLTQTDIKEKIDELEQMIDFYLHKISFYRDKAAESLDKYTKMFSGVKSMTIASRIEIMIHNHFHQGLLDSLETILSVNSMRYTIFHGLNVANINQLQDYKFNVSVDKEQGKEDVVIVACGNDREHAEYGCDHIRFMYTVIAMNELEQQCVKELNELKRKVKR